VPGDVPIADCPSSIGPLGPFTPARDRFHATEGIITGIRLRGSDNKYYEIYGGVRILATTNSDGLNPRHEGHAYIIVERYASAILDPCRAFREHTSDRPQARQYDFPGLGAIQQISGTGDLVTLRSATSARTFNFVGGK
jgi:hypothetical protein